MSFFGNDHVYRVVYPTDHSVKWMKNGRWKLVHKESATLFNSESEAWDKAKEIYHNYYDKNDLIRKGFTVRKN